MENTIDHMKSKELEMEKNWRRSKNNQKERNVVIRGLKAAQSPKEVEELVKYLLMSKLKVGCNSDFDRIIK